MPELLIKNETNFTVIQNLESVCKALHRSEEAILRYFGHTIGAQINVKKRSINGSYTKKYLQDALSIMIEKYVTCKQCGNPETHILKSHNEKYSMSCSACGVVTKLPSDKILKYMV
jgi:translation initiation factor 2 beta subunit (eIF-2beta)/eIF-5